MYRHYSVWVKYPTGKADLRLVKASSVFEAKVLASGRGDGEVSQCVVREFDPRLEVKGSDKV